METSLHYPRKIQTAIVIPAYQPSARLVDLAKYFCGCGYMVIIVDDGSGAAYSPIWKAISDETIIIHHPKNRGKGAALKSAFELIFHGMPEINCILTVDADGQHLPSDVDRVALASWEHPGALILGTRKFSGYVPLRSKLGNSITCFVFSRVSKTKLQDTQTGLRAFDRWLFPHVLKIKGERYEYEMNALLYCAERGIPIVEVPIQTIYLDRSNSCSHFNGIFDSIRIYSQIIKFASASLFSFFADYLLFLILSALLPSGIVYLTVCNILARIVSAMLNYTLNAKIVFRGNQCVRQTLLRYICLAAGILAGNCVILSLLVNITGFPPSAAKLLTEAILFIASYIIQSRVIFREKAACKEVERDHVTR